MNRTMRTNERRWSPILILLSVALLALVLGSHIYMPERVSSLGARLLHSLHAPGFAVVSLVVLVVLRLRGHDASAYWKAAAISFAIGILSEIFQAFLSRDAEVIDLIYDATGIYGALAVVSTIDPAIRRKAPSILLPFILLSGIAALTLAFRDTVGTAGSIIRRYENLPVLLGFEAPWESYLYEESEGNSAAVVSNPDNWPVTSGGSVLLADSIGRWETLLHMHPYPDWRDYEYFSFLAASPADDKVRITVSIRDTRPGPDSDQVRFSRNIDVTSEPRRFRFALAELRDHSDKRPFDLAHVETVVISGSKKNVDVRLLLDDFRLE